jgi:hypothetical protein
MSAYKVIIVLLVTNGTALSLGINAKADALPSCFSAPVRADDSWQNWYATNNCGGAVTIRWTQQGSDGRTNPGVAVAEACSSRTRILQTFLNDKITKFYFQWNDADINKRCSAQNSTSAPPPPVRSGGNAQVAPQTDLSNLIREQKEKSSGADGVNTANENEVVDLARERQEVDYQIQQNKIRRDRMRKEQEDAAAAAIIGGFVEGLSSTAPRAQTPNTPYPQRVPSNPAPSPPPAIAAPGSATRETSQPSGNCTPIYYGKTMIGC